MRRVVSLYLPTWPTDRLRRGRRLGRPEKSAAAAARRSDRPLVTVVQDGQRRLLAGVDDAARRCGLSSGMALAQARAMVAGIEAVPADPAAEQAGLVRLAAWCQRRYSPIVALDPPDGLWLDITGCAHLMGGEAALLADLHRRLARAGVAARMAVADTPGAAWALARCGTDAAAPARVVPPGSAAAALDPLPLAALRLDAEAIDGLRRLGLVRVGQVRALPRGTLGLRYGPMLLGRLDQALGAAAETLVPLASPAMPRRRLDFAEPIGHRAGLAAALARLAADLCRDLEAGGLGLRCCDLVVQRVDGAAQALRVGAARAMRDPAHLGRLFDERLDRVDPGFGIEAMTLLAPRTERLAPRQLRSDLGAPGAADCAPDLAVLIDRLANRLGAERLYRLAPVESDLPERAARRVAPLAPPAGAAWPAELPRPGRLFDPPEPVAVTALLPDHPPAHFRWRRRHHRVRRADGPERLYGEWWRDAAEVTTVRDYFQVEDEAGGRYWLFRDGTAQDGAGGGRWYLHGLFG